MFCKENHIDVANAGAPMKIAVNKWKEKPQKKEGALPPPNLRFDSQVCIKYQP